MSRIFAFADRAIPVQFFEEEPITITLHASDETDAKILESAKLIQAGDRQATVGARLDKYRQAVDNLIGSDTAEQVLARADRADGYALLSLYQGVLDAYSEGKRKNLMASR